MARREWADKLYEKAQRLKEPDDQFSRLPDYLVLRLLKAEHARAVRVVKRELAERERTLANAALPSFDYDWVEPQVVVLRRILDILQKGRA